MAAAFTVPDRDRKALSELGSLSHDRLHALIEALKQARPALLIRQLAARVALAAAMSESEASKIIRLVARMSYVRTRNNLSIQAFVDRVCEVAFGKDQEPQISPDVQAILKDYLRQLLSINPLYITGKALEIMHDNQHTLCESRVITDLRTVFDLDGKPAAAMAVHMLRISYHEGLLDSDRKQIVVSLDSEDVRELKSILDRAEAKEGMIKDIAVNSRLLWLNPGEDE